jgi:hypothetical protein
MSPELKAQLAQMAQQIQALTAAAGGAAPAALPATVPPPGFAAPAPPGGAAWLTPPAPQGAMPAPLGWSVVMEIVVQGPQGQGKATVDLCYGPETWGQAPQIVAALITQGYPVKVWVPKPAGGFGGGGFKRPWGG